MRIQRLLLKAFGPFTAVELDLEGPAGAINVVLGANEAGKSSSLRALEGFCFGIPERSADDHVHNYDRMCIGATLALADGSTETFYRRKRRKNSLTDSSDAAVPDEILDRFLCGVGKSGFEALFCLSYQRLTQGSESLLEEGGEIGKILFEARSDINLRPIQEALASRADELYKPTANARGAINKALREYDEERKVLRRGDIAEYKSLRTDLAKLETDALAAKENLRLSRAERSALERRIQAVPQVADLGRARAALDNLGPVPDLPVGFADDFRAAALRRQTAQLALDTVEAQHGLTVEKLAGLSIDEGVLAWREKIDDLNRQVQQIRKHVADIPGQRDKALSAISAARAALWRVRPGEEPDEAHLQLGQSEGRINALGLEFQKLDADSLHARKEVLRLEEAIADAKRRLGEIAMVQASDELVAALVAAQRLGDVDDRVRLDEAEFQALGGRITRLAKALHLDPDSDSIADLTPPSATLIDEYAEKWNRATNVVGNAERRVETALMSLNSAEDQLKRLALGGSVPNPADLADVRKARDAMWTELRGNLALESPQQVPESNLQSYERGVSDADGMADTMRREADRVANQATLELEAMTAKRDLDQARSALAEALSRQSELTTEWESRWTPIGVAPDSPRPMAAWRTEFDKLQDRLVDAATLAMGARERRRARDAARSRLAAAMGRAADVDELGVLVVEAAEQVSQAHQRKGQVEALERQIREDDAALAAALTETERLGGARETWHKNWVSETACLRLPLTPTVAEASLALQAIREAAQHLSDAANAQRRVDGMERDKAHFDSDVAEVVGAMATDLKSIPELDAVKALYKRLGDANNLDVKRTQWTFDKTSQEEAIGAAKSDLSRAEKRLGEMAAQAGCTPADLGDVVARFETAEMLRKEVGTLESLLSGAATPRPLADFCRDVEAMDLDVARVLLEDLDAGIEGIEKTEGELNRDIGRLQSALAAKDSDSAQLDSLVRAEDALARVRSAVPQYLLYATAECLIRAQIEEFRRANQGPILRKAAEIFAVLTDGSFSDLTSELDDKDRPVLLAVRSRQSGVEERLKVDALSSATRMGLYLALRLACVYHHVERREGVPFVADDILLDFDDARARRVMGELGRLAEKTQVIIFTHHKHLVEIGKDALGERCLVQELGSPTQLRATA